MKCMRLELKWAALAFSMVVLLTSSPVGAGDWPTWRYDGARSAASPEQLPGELHLQWRRDNRPLVPAWPEDPRQYFDASYEPVVMGGTMFVASSRNDSVTALDTESGERKWRFYAEGPVRFAPVAVNGRVYFGADDGSFYCLDAGTGRVEWTFRAALNDRKVIGNSRLISVWPLRGGPVLVDGTIYFTAGVWPFEGTFLYAIDAATGRVASVTSTAGVGTASPGGPLVLKDRTPQGYLAGSAQRLFIPCGRSTVTCLDRESGKFVGFGYSTSRATSYHVAVTDRWLFHGSVNYDMQTKQTAPISASVPVLASDTLYTGIKGQVVAFDLANPKVVESKDRRGKTIKSSVPEKRWSLAAGQIRDVPKKDFDKWIKANPLLVDVKAGNRLYGHYGNTVFAVDLPSDGDSEGAKAKVSWKATIEGSPSSMLAADGKLFVVTKEGSIYCFGGEKTEPRIHRLEEFPAVAVQDAWTGRAAEILEHSGVKNAYCLVPGVGSGRLIEEMARQSDLQIIGIDPDAAKVSKLRRRLDAEGLYGTRVELRVGDPLEFGLPPYVASLVVSEDLDAAGFARGESFVRSMFEVLRPYGGTAYLAIDARDHESFASLVSESKLAGAEVKRVGQFTLLSRVGALPGAADWTHEYGDPANSLTSRDELVKAPLGVLWFGGPASSGELFYNRHYWGPSMAVAGGRMFIQGPGKLTAVDVYTGRILWQTPLEYNENYNPERRGNDFEKSLAGFHFLAVDDAIYLTLGREILRIDPVDGKIVSKFTPPSESDEWGRIRVEDDVLLASICRDGEALGESPGKLPVELVAMNRHDGRTLWTKKANLSFPVVSVSGDKVFCFDGHLEDLYRAWQRKGLTPKANDIRVMKALDLATGEEVWKRTTDFVAVWMAYSHEADVLMVSNKTGMSAFRGEDGSELWRKQAEGKGFRGHPENLWDKIIVSGDRVIDQRGPGFAYDIETGDPILRKHPVTNEPIEWQFTKSGHHCNYAIASPHLLTFRAAEAGFCDIESGETARLGGFRSGCRNSLIPANGVLNAPNFAHGCVCGYPLFTSLALVHMPETEMWSYSPLTLEKGEQVERVGINIGAPGDRLSAAGTLWLDYPSVGGTSPAVPVKLTGAGQRMFQTHSALVEGESLRWVAASGVEGASVVTVTLNGDPAKAESRRYTVRLVFAEPNDFEPTERVFGVSLQGKEVLSNFDVVREAGGRNRVVVREFLGVMADKELVIGLEPAAGKSVLSGVEIVAEAR